MKKRSLLVIILNIILMTSTVYGAETKAEFIINTGNVSVDNCKISGNSLSYNSVTYLPVRKIAEALGLNVVFDNNTNTAKLTSGGKVIKNSETPVVSSKKVKDNLQLNNIKLYVDGVYVDSDNILYGGTTYLPLRDIAEILGVTVDYDKTTRMINLSTSENSALKPMLKQGDITYPKEPKTVEDFEKVLLYMANNNLDRLDINYSPNYDLSFVYNNKIGSNLGNALNNVYYKYIDLFSGVTAIDFDTSSTSENFVITVKLTGMNIDNLSFIESQKSFETKAKELNESLKSKGSINTNMTQSEVAKVLYTQVTQMLEYDVNTTKGTNVNQASFTGYGAIKNNIAVCQGYTALYNYLLKLNGIECIGQAGKLNNTYVTHIWTVAILDGEKSYIDTTFGDSSSVTNGNTDYTYFDIDKNILSSDRSGVE